MYDLNKEDYEEKLLMIVNSINKEMNEKCNYEINSLEKNEEGD